MTKSSPSPRNSQANLPRCPISSSPPSAASSSRSRSPSPSPKIPCLIELEKGVFFRSRLDGVNAYYIRTEEELHLAFSALHQLGSPIISLDLEGVHLSKDGPVSLLHIYDGKVTFIFDVLLLQDKLFTAGNGFLKDILCSTTITKVMFDCRKDCEALYHQYGVKLDNVIDVQMAEIIYRYKIIRDVPRYFIGLASAVEQYNILKSFDNFETYSSIRNAALDKYSPSRGGRIELWGDRPLDLGLLFYCAEDIKNIYRLYTKVFAKKLTYETCIGVSMLRLRESMNSDINGDHSSGCTVYDIISATTPRSRPSSPTGVKCFVNFDVEVFSKFEDSMQQYRKMGLVK